MWKWRILLVSFVDKIRGISEKPLERLQKIGVKEGMKFLDVGCGLGFYSFPASLLVGENGLVYALDIDSDYLKWIANKARKTRRVNIKTINADACKIGLPDDNVDIVFLHLVFHDIKDKSAAIKEFYRVLKAGGKLVIDEENVMSLKKVRMWAEDGGLEFSERLYKTLQIFKKPASDLPSK
jgi:ubiquinone/menaquinone biosynthesis C-methylase UbiE